MMGLKKTTQIALHVGALASNWALMSMFGFAISCIAVAGAYFADDVVDGIVEFRRARVSLPKV